MMLEHFDKENIELIKVSTHDNGIGELIEKVTQETIEAVVTKGSFKTTNLNGQTTFIRGYKVHIDNSIKVDRNDKFIIRGLSFKQLNAPFFYTTHQYIEVISNEQ